MNALTALLHPGELLHPMRRYGHAADQIAEALDHDRRWNPAAMESVEDGARQLYLAASSVHECVQCGDALGSRHAVIETAVAGMRLAAERPDPLRTDTDQAYRIAAANAWADLLGEQEHHPQAWTSPDAGAQELAIRAQGALSAAEQSDTAGVEAAASLTAAACIRYLAEVNASMSVASSRWGKAA